MHPTESDSDEKKTAGGGTEASEKTATSSGLASLVALHHMKSPKRFEHEKPPGGTARRSPDSAAASPPRSCPRTASGTRRPAWRAPASAGACRPVWPTPRARQHRQQRQRHREPRERGRHPRVPAEHVFFSADRQLRVPAKHVFVFFFGEQVGRTRRTRVRCTTVSRPAKKEWRYTRKIFLTNASFRPWGKKWLQHCRRSPASFVCVWLCVCAAPRTRLGLDGRRAAGFVLFLVEVVVGAVDGDRGDDEHEDDLGGAVALVAPPLVSSSFLRFLMTSLSWPRPQPARRRRARTPAAQCFG